MLNVKRVVSKCQRVGASSSSTKMFIKADFQECYKALLMKPIVQIQTFDWGALEHLDLVDDV